MAGTLLFIDTYHACEHAWLCELTWLCQFQDSDKFWTKSSTTWPWKIAGLNDMRISPYNIISLGPNISYCEGKSMFFSPGYGRKWGKCWFMDHFCLFVSPGWWLKCWCNTFNLSSLPPFGFIGKSVEVGFWCFFLHGRSPTSVTWLHVTCLLSPPLWCLSIFSLGFSSIFPSHTSARVHSLFPSYAGVRDFLHTHFHSWRCLLSAWYSLATGELIPLLVRLLLFSSQTSKIRCCSSYFFFFLILGIGVF